MLIDTHCHLSDPRLCKQLPGVLARAAEAGVGVIISAAASVPDSEAACRLADQNDNVYCIAGVHPHDAKDAPEDYLARLAELAGRPKCVAVGETGLDYHYDLSPRDLQRRVFAAQLDLAARLTKPVVVHTREALDDTLAVLAEADLPGERVVFHSFTGGPADVRRVLDTGAQVGYSGIATFSKAGPIRDGAAMVPDERIMVETDGPYLSPEPVRKMKTNEPANVRHVAACLAAARGMAAEAFAELTTANARRLFGIDISTHSRL